MTVTMVHVQRRYTRAADHRVVLSGASANAIKYEAQCSRCYKCTGTMAQEENVASSATGRELCRVIVGVSLAAFPCDMRVNCDKFTTQLF